MEKATIHHLDHTDQLVITEFTGDRFTVVEGMANFVNSKHKVSLTIPVSRIVKITGVSE